MHIYIWMKYTFFIIKQNRNVEQVADTSRTS